ncbi:MAG: UDP-N-acetylglucosamine--N-acetylmuramyl-(pentapeptide) pyrophosphoryl-undecaprenol N-acetylglucosamine transferase [Gemmatimonadaceae bacterium]|nr:UDP-N-acetylglucosamine--N-acetylmuramyl-(pentapeptide) pyrophosphoryl-undecaprenol N-acetylglucosamine transferase [Gemmatimonadaceae bacterium]
MTTAESRRRVWFAGGGTGGHLYPGLAIARALVALDPGVEPFFVGAARGIERTVLPGQPFGHVLLDLHPIYRQRPWENWKTLRGALGAWRTLDRLADTVPPALVVGTGGYAMGLAAAWGGWHRVPVVQQVADVVPGLTAKLASRWSHELYLGFPEAARHLAGGEKIATGNPIEPPPSPRPDRAAARAKWGFPQSGGRVVLVFGGSQGARAINDAVAEWVRRGVGEHTYVLWATGTAQYDRYASLESAGRVRVLPYLSPIADGYSAADLAVTRAGAMTCAELTAWGIPAVMIPLPTAAADHQTTNARTLEDAGCAVFFPQSRLTPESLSATIAMMVEEPGRLDRMGAAAKARARPNAAKDIAARVLMIVNGESLK